MSSIRLAHHAKLTRWPVCFACLTVSTTGAAMAYGVQNDKRVALGTSALLLVVMTRRFFVSRSQADLICFYVAPYITDYWLIYLPVRLLQRTGKFMPAGLVSLFSAFFTYNYYQLLFAWEVSFFVFRYGMHLTRNQQYYPNQSTNFCVLPVAVYTVLYELVTDCVHSEQSCELI